MLLSVLILCLCLAKSFGEDSVEITDRYSLDWKTDGGEITFTVTAKATGWIGLGFGPSKRMKNADLIVGGVKDGKGYLFDMHGVDDDTPAPDQQEDYHLLEGSENSTHTVLKFKRKLDTGDKDDMTLKSPVWVLWAFHTDEDASNGKWPYHSNDRGHEKNQRTF